MFLDGLAVTAVTQGETESAYNETWASCTELPEENAARQHRRSDEPCGCLCTEMFPRPAQTCLWASLDHTALNRPF